MKNKVKIFANNFVSISITTACFWKVTNGTEASLEVGFNFLQYRVLRVYSRFITYSDFSYISLVNKSLFAKGADMTYWQSSVNHHPHKPPRAILFHSVCAKETRIWKSAPSGQDLIVFVSGFVFYLRVMYAGIRSSERWLTFPCVGEVWLYMHAICWMRHGQVCFLA